MVMLRTRKNHHPAGFNRFLSSIAMILAINIVIGLQSQNIDNWAHAGGFISGILFGGAYAWLKFSPRAYVIKIFSNLALALISLTLFAGIGQLFSQESLLDKFPYEPAAEGQSYVKPERWVFIRDRYYDPFNGAQIILTSFDGSSQSRFNEIIEGYSNKFTLSDQQVLGNELKSIVLNNKDRAEYSLIVLLNERTGDEVFVFIEQAYALKYLSVIDRMFE
jgi:hypothetical protein